MPRPSAQRVTAAADAKAVVHIELEVEAENVSGFLADWDEIVQKLIEQADVKEAWMEMPAARIELERW